MKYGIYLYEGEIKNSDFKKQLTKEAVFDFCQRRALNQKLGLDWEKIQIMHETKGKPYLGWMEDETGVRKEIPVYFNVSHSNELWICMVGQAPCGIDLQVCRDCDYEKLGKRFFHEEEQAFIEKYQMEGFFRLWVRREAYGKFTGEGFFSKSESLVTQDGQLKDQIGEGYLKDLPIASDILCTYCTGGEDDEIEFFG